MNKDIIEDWEEWDPDKWSMWKGLINDTSTNTSPVSAVVETEIETDFEI